MPCPVCACDATRPLAMREVNGFAGASHVCDTCLAVWFVVSDAVISRVALASAARGWRRTELEARLVRPATGQYDLIVLTQVSGEGLPYKVEVGAPIVIDAERPTQALLRRKRVGRHGRSAIASAS